MSSEKHDVLICALLVCCCGCFAALRLCLVNILVGSKQLAWGVMLGEEKRVGNESTSYRVAYNTKG